MNFNARERNKTNNLTNNNMSELENKIEETPKRKRRTKAEIEEAKKNGTYKPRKKTSKVTEQEEKENAVEQKKITLSPEQSVLIMSCLNPSVSMAACNAAKKEGVQVVILEDKVIYDYLERSRKQEDLSEFLSDTSNRLKAESDARRLYAILTKGGNIEDSRDKVFNTTQIVKCTNLSHSKTASLIELFRAFGLIRLVRGIHEFMFTFTPEMRRKSIGDEILGMLKVMNTDIQRYKASIYNDDSLSSEQKENMYRDFQKSFNEQLEF